MSEPLSHQNLSVLLSSFFERPSLQANDSLVDDLEFLFEYPDFDNFDFHQFITELIKTPFWLSNSYPNNKVKDLCLDLSKHIEISHQTSLDEPAYHSRFHFKDVCLGLTALLGVSFDLNSQSHNLQWDQEPKDTWIFPITGTL